MAHAKLKDQPNAQRDDVISIRGARTNNLKNIDVEIPRDQLVCITGRSGSGKSSLAFGTLFAEGQRQYIESLSLYSRQFFKQMVRADVDSIVGLQPTLSLDQHVGTSSRRSTVATVTEIYDYLRVLMARVGEIRCHGCGEPIQQQTPQRIRDILLRLPEKTKVMILAPMVVGKKGGHAEVFKAVRNERLVRVRVDGEIHDIDRIPTIDANLTHTIEAVADRIIVREGIEDRLLEAIDLATRLGKGRVTASFQSKTDDGKTAPWEERLFSTNYACAPCDINYAEVEPRSFSFNSPFGACAECSGLGSYSQFDAELIIKDRSLSLADDPVVPWAIISPAKRKKLYDQLQPVAERIKISMMTPLSKLDEKQWHELMNCAEKSTPGLTMLLEKELATSTNEERVEQLEAYLDDVSCPICKGTRLNAQARAVFFDGKSIGDLTSMSVEAACDYFTSVATGEFLDTDSQEIAAPLLDAIQHRLKFLNEIGVGYLTLDRGANTLSGGELQRVRLANSIGSGLTSVCYVLDEPSIGLHPRDNDRLITAVRNLQKSGNSIVVVEHDEAMIRAADYVIDIGPGAGSHGGRVAASGAPSEVAKEGASLTGSYLSGKLKIEAPKLRRSRTGEIEIKGANGFNLKNIDVDIPLGVFVCVTGVSGSGKSTLVNGTLIPGISRALGLVASRPAEHRSISGFESIDKLVRVDQRPLGKSTRGCAATYTGVFAEIRKLFAATRFAKEKGFAASRFSFNSPAGRCEDCLGHGTKRVKMNFLSDLFVVCESCNGKRYNEQTLQVTFRNLSIADVLRLSVDDALEEYGNFSRVVRILQSLSDVGLGYLSLGQPAVTLSGGEAQRIKLARQLANPSTGQTLFVMDEPTTGLHMDDVKRLIGVLQKLVDLGNSLIVVEHNLDVIKTADWLIDLGPDGGQSGGEVVAVGTPEEVAKISSSTTGRFLQELM